MMDEQKIDGRTREGRAMRQPGEPKTQRRRRADNLGPSYNLAVTGELDRERYAYRWVNDDERARLYRMTVQDDWDIVTTSGEGVTAEKQDSLADAVKIVVGAKKDGSPMHSVLCRKPLHLYEEDKAQKMRPIDEMEAAIKGNRLFESNGPAADASFYNPRS